MANEGEKIKEVNEQDGETGGGETGKVGAKPVGLIGILLIAGYVVVVSIILVYCIVEFWPSQVPEGKVKACALPVRLLFWKFSVSDEVRLMLIVVLAGALGGQVRTLRSLSWYVGNRILRRSWLILYILTPFVGATLALVFYLVIRGGFFSAESTVEQASVYGFAGLASLVGMFSEQAVLRLKKVAETLLAKPKPGSDAKPQE